MIRYSRPFKALWLGEVISELGGTAGGIINGLLLYELTGSREWVGALWLVYFIPSLVFQFISAPFLNHTRKEKMLCRIQIIRAGSYLLPFAGFLVGNEMATVGALILLQCLLGLLQPVYASLSFSILPDICNENELVKANGFLDGTLRLMGFLTPALTSIFLLAVPLYAVYGISSVLFLSSYFAISHITLNKNEEGALWTKKFWWIELKQGYITFFSYPHLIGQTILSSTVQFAVGVSMVLSVPFIMEDLGGQHWEYAVFSGAFPVGYVIGMLLLRKLPRKPTIMYLGLAGGGLSFFLLQWVKSVPAAWLCELFGGLLFPLFNAQSAAIFQCDAPENRLAQLSAVRLLFLRLTMPLGTIFASTTFLDLSTRQLYGMAGIVVMIPGLIAMLLPIKKAGSVTVKS